ncbi:MAG: hypothetical protein ACI4PK_03780, partial [Oscillospiraceae bacterium]
MLEAVQKGEVDVVIDAETFVEMEMNKNPELYVDCASYTIIDKTEEICVAVPIESKRLFEWINVCIETSNDYSGATIEDVKKHTQNILKRNERDNTAAKNAKFQIKTLFKESILFKWWVILLSLCLGLLL